MIPKDPVFANEGEARIQADLRQQIATLLFDRLELITADAVSIFPFSGTTAFDADYCRRVGHVIVRLLAIVVRDGHADARGGFVTDLYRVALERNLTPEQLFTFVYLSERTTLDEVALSDTIGATSEPWPAVAQIVRRASFDLLAAYTERSQLEPRLTSIVDPLTTVYTRPLMDAVLAKEAERAGRYGYTISLILFDVDHLSRINAEHGYGVGDKVLERLGILLRKYFRHHDWVARMSEDSFAVLLTRTDPEQATGLAEDVRATVEQRLEFVEYRTDSPVAVTVSAAVLNVPVTPGDTIDPERLIADAEVAVERAKRQGRNRVERVDGYSGAVIRANSAKG